MLYMNTVSEDNCLYLLEMQLLSEIQRGIPNTGANKVVCHRHHRCLLSGIGLSVTGLICLFLLSVPVWDAQLLIQTTDYNPCIPSIHHACQQNARGEQQTWDNVNPRDASLSPAGVLDDLVVGEKQVSAAKFASSQQDPSLSDDPLTIFAYDKGVLLRRLSAISQQPATNVKHGENNKLYNDAMGERNVGTASKYSPYINDVIYSFDQWGAEDVGRRKSDVMGKGVTMASGGKATRRLPQAIIIGVKKGGTRALLEFLRIHPDVRAPGPEPHYFDRNYNRGLQWYRRQMPTSLDSQLTMEKTPSYFVTRDVPARIYNMSRDVKLVIVVRDPVTRAISDYAQAVAKRPDLPPFHKLVFVNGTRDVINTSWGPIRIGLYARHLERWLRYFPLRQLHFVSGERLIENPAAELAMVQDFLGLKRVVSDKHFFLNTTKGFPCLKKTENSGGSPRCLGSSKGRMHPFIDPEVITKLREFYRPFNRLFYSVTGIDFGWQ